MAVTLLESVAADRLRRPGETLDLGDEVERRLVERGVAVWADGSGPKRAQPSKDTSPARQGADSGSPAPPGAGDSQSQAPGGDFPAERGERIRAAAAKAAGDPAMCTKSGSPTVGALRELTGLADVTAKERDAALDAIQPPG